VRRQRFGHDQPYRGHAEQTHAATHEPAGLAVKVRPDRLIDSPQKRRRTLVDFKTSRCQDLAQFLETVDKYGYDRQGALFADVLGAHRVVLSAVQEKPAQGPEPQVWAVELTAGQMHSGRKKSGKLLRCAAEQRHQSGGPLATALAQDFGRATLPHNNLTRHLAAASPQPPPPEPCEQQPTSLKIGVVIVAHVQHVCEQLLKQLLRRIKGCENGFPCYPVRNLKLVRHEVVAVRIHT
jgi:hypothetical protein